jgi:hypothetical protein
VGKRAFTEDQIRALVDEALHRTPRGGFPELEKREGLKPGTLFDWVDEYGPSAPPAPFSALHFWIGTTTLSEEAFAAYFDVPDAYWADEDLSAVEAGIGFNVDLDEQYAYDEDLLLVTRLETPLPVSHLVEKSALESDASALAIVKECARRGIHTANAMFVYGDPTQLIPDTQRTYNGLPYIGLYPSKG